MLLQFRIGSVLGRGLSIWLRNVIPFSILVSLVYAPLLIYTGVVLAGDLSLAAITAWVYFVAAGGFLLKLIASAVIIYGVIQQLRGKPIRIGPCLAVGLKRLVPVICVGLASGGLLALSSYLYANQGYEGVSIIIFLPGIAAFLVLFVAVPVTVVERTGAISSLRRSAALTRGYRSALLVIMVIPIVIEETIQFTLHHVMIGGEPTELTVRMFLGAVIGLEIIFGALTAVIAAVAYVDLKTLKGGVDIEELAGVFG